MALSEAPDWLMGEASGEREAKQLKRSATDLLSQAGSKGDRDILQKLVVVLTKLELQGQQELRELIGVTYHTFLVKNDQEEHPLLKSMLNAGEAYNMQAKKMKERKDAGEEVDLAALGPPFVQ
eukprot:3601432-Karenia_brevis.AAC.1